jgi:hypothetical protein
MKRRYIVETQILERFVEEVVAESDDEALEKAHELCCEPYAQAVDYNWYDSVIISEAEVDEEEE